ncbi:MAG: hypothetical protein M3Q55_12555 [Acidobacteriota bacterium]|nr:hypothetical protein [Acidobacteriota bacterium]
MLKIVSAVSGVYDLVVGAVLFLFTAQMAAAFGVAPPVPEVHAKLNALFLMVIGAGYYLPWREPDRYRAYLWLMGPILKGAGAAVFVADYLLNGSPAAFLLFAASDGILALWTLAALLRQGQRPLPLTPYSRVRASRRENP